ncbi:hypothetical protein PMIN07_005743 [Paraphaeosphaeria minitans]
MTVVPTDSRVQNNEAFLTPSVRDCDTDHEEEVLRFRAPSNKIMDLAGEQLDNQIEKIEKAYGLMRTVISEMSSPLEVNSRPLGFPYEARGFMHAVAIQFGPELCQGSDEDIG